MNQTRSLATVLYLLFLPLLIGAVGTTSWMANRAGEQSVAEVATALCHAYEDRIRHSVISFLSEPTRVTRINLSEVELGMLDPTDMEFVQRRIAQQVIDFGSVAYIYYGTADGDAVGFQREVDDSYTFSRLDEAGNLATYEAREDLSRGALLDPGAPYDPRQRPWYRAGSHAGTTTWTDIYVWFGRDQLCIDVVAPVYDVDKRLVGVLDAGYTLGQLSTFLESLEIGKTGEAFILDSDGLVVATSTGLPLVIPDGDKVRRITPTELASPLSSFLGESLEVLDSSEGSSRVVHPELGPLTVMVRPLEVDDQLGWTLAVAIPQSDFTEHYEALRKQTFYLTLLAILLTVLAVLTFVRRLAKPLRSLVKAANRVRYGELDITLPPVTRDEIGQLTLAMSEMVAGLRERETIREAFGRYVTEEVAEKVLADPEAMRLGGVRRRVTILMSDLRGFTARSNQLDPEDLIHLLNEYLGEMTLAILANEGLIVEFIGDAILVLFGATGSRTDDAERAARCALEMHTRLDALNVALLGRGISVLQMGIGVHTGDVIVGNIGSEHRIKFGVVGDAVNTTARVEALTVGGQILVSESTGEGLSASLKRGPPATTRVKGLTKPLVVYELLRTRAAQTCIIPDTVTEATSATLYQMVNKTLSEEAVQVDIERVAIDRLFIRTPVPLAAFEDVLVVIGDQGDGSGLVRMYCKVVEGSHTDVGEVHDRTLIVTAVADVGSH
jgi:class 3 adenylate cyclase